MLQLMMSLAVSINHIYKILLQSEDKDPNTSEILIETLEKQLVNPHPSTYTILGREEITDNFNFLVVNFQSCYNKHIL